MLSAEDKIIRAKVSLQRTHPFFAYLVLHLKQKEEAGIDTMGVDVENNLFYNKNWVEKLSEEDTTLCLIHEVLHIALMHLIRREKRDEVLWNFSADLIANKIIELNFQDIYPNSVIERECITEELLEEKFSIKIKDLEKKTVEEVYDILEKHYTNKTNFKEFVDKYKFDIHFDLDSLSEEDKRKLEQKFGKSFKEIKKDIEDEIRKRLVEANQFSKLRGTEPLGMERFFDKLLDFKLNWKALLHKYITQEIPYDYSWKRPSRKSISTGIYLPTTIKEKLEVVCVVDLSGSIDQEELDEFLTEIVNLAKSFNNIKITVLTHDVVLQDRIEVENGNIDKLMKIKMHGYGGTSHQWLPEYLRENLPQTRLIVCLTDGFTEFPKEEELGMIKTIWVISKNGCDLDSIPFGYKIKLE
jgi:predicted metal-dependent peptidase